MIKGGACDATRRRFTGQERAKVITGLGTGAAAGGSEQRDTELSLLRAQELDWWPWHQKKGTEGGPLRRPNN